jgi:hypothetical protein
MRLLPGVLLLLPAMIQQPDLMLDGKVAGKPTKPRPGEICAVCGGALGPEDVVYEIEGQRLGVMKAMDGELRANLRSYVARLRPRGAFLGAHPPGAGGPSAVLVWLLAPPAAALLALLLWRRRAATALPTAVPQPCPGCGSPNHPAARGCLNCGRELQPALESEVTRAR